MRYLVVLLLVAVAVIAYAQNPQSQRSQFVLQIAADGRIAWRMNGNTGEISYCVPETPITGNYRCEPWKK